MNFLGKILHVLICTNVYIGLCAVAMVYYTALFFQSTQELKLEAVFVFFATVFTYSFLKYRGAGREAETLHRRWAIQHPTLSKLILVVSLFCTIIFFSLLNTNEKLLTACIALVTLSYSFAPSVSFLPKLSLRNFAVAKVVWVALVWSATTVLLPAIDLQWHSYSFILFFLKQFLFVAALTLLFDIPDAEGDMQHHLQTFATKYGAGNTRLMSICLLACVLVVDGRLFLSGNISIPFLVAELLTLLLSCMTIYLLSKKASPFGYYLFADGLLLVQLFTAYCTCKILV